MVTLQDAADLSREMKWELSSNVSKTFFWEEQAMLIYWPVFSTDDSY